MALIRGLFWIVVFGAVVYGAYLLSVGFSDESLESVKGEVTDTIAGLQETTSQEGEKILSEVSDSAGEYVKDRVGDVISSVGESIVRFGGNVVGETVEKVTGQDTEISVPKVITEISEGKTVVSTALFVEPGEFISLFIRGGGYRVSWGEGGSDELIEDVDTESTILHHSWNESGTYIVTVKGISDEGLIYTLPVHVSEK